jgi:hypothetical protein
VLFTPSERPDSTSEITKQHDQWPLLAVPRLDPSYRRAAELFEQVTAELPGGPWTLHQLRRSALTHAAEGGANTSTLLAYSGHTFRAAR